MRARRISLLAVAVAPCTLLLVACGSSGSSGTAATTTGAATAKTAATKTGTASGGSSLKVTGKPKFASPSSSEEVLSGTVQVAYRNITISPDTLRVKAGTTVRWTNYDPTQHNVTSESGPQRFASRNFGDGHTFEIKLTHPGTINYECTNHPATMNGTIEVTG
jgi:plastocyanin